MRLFWHSLTEFKRVMMEKVSFIKPACAICKRVVPEGYLYYLHPKHGLVCEFCPEFKDGGIEVEDG